MPVQIIQSDLFVELSLQEQQFLSGGVNEAYVEQQSGVSEAQRWRLRPSINGTYFIENVRLTRERGVPMVLDYRT